MEILQYNNFKENFSFVGVLEEKSMLDSVKMNTFSGEVRETCNEIQERLLNGNRPKKDLENTVFFCYVLYVLNFTSGLRENFDAVYNWLKHDKKQYVNEITIREALKRMVL